MARDFAKDGTEQLEFAAGAVENLLDGAAKVSIACLCNFDTLGTAANDNRVTTITIAGSPFNVGFLLGVRNNTGVLCVRAGARSGNADGFQVDNGTTSLAASTWHHIGAVFDFPAATIRGYANGAQDFSTAVTWANTTFVLHDALGQSVISGNVVSPTTANQWDGKIAEFAIWTDDIGTAGFAALSQGMAPTMVRPDALVVYLPIYGNNSPELELVNRLTVTVDGTPDKVAHPRVYRPSAQILRFPAPSGSIITSFAPVSPFAVGQTGIKLVGTGFGT